MTWVTRSHFTEKIISRELTPLLGYSTIDSRSFCLQSRPTCLFPSTSGVRCSQTTLQLKYLAITAILFWISLRSSYIGSGRHTWSGYVAGIPRECVPFWSVPTISTPMTSMWLRVPLRRLRTYIFNLFVVWLLL